MTVDQTAEQWRERAAARLVEELKAEPSGRKYAKISSLLHAFSNNNVHTDVGDLLSISKERGLQLLSPRQHISRRDVVEVVLAAGENVAGPSGNEIPVRVTRWRPGNELSPERLDQLSRSPKTSGETLWFDVDPVGVDPNEDDVLRLVEMLQPHCPGLKTVMIRDLLTADVQPKAETYGDERSGVRTVSIPALVAREIPDEDDAFDGLDEQLLTQMVELLVGPGWIVTCWHPGRVLVGGGRARRCSGLLRAPFLAHVEHRWLNDPVEEGRSEEEKGASDLATYLARALVATYGASLRMLQRWVSTWEVEFYQALGGLEDGGHETRDHKELLRGAATEISNFLSLVGEFSRSVDALQLAGEEMPNKTWFVTPGGISSSDRGEPLQAEQARLLGASVDAAARKLDQLSDEIRADMDLLMIHSQTRQQESSERLQGYLGKVTGLILVPTFVAGLYGANTALPGGGSWMGFDIMLLLMVASAAVSYFFIRRIVG